MFPSKIMSALLLPVLLLLGHQPTADGSATAVLPPFVRFLETNHGCECHGDHVHCDDPEFEALCTCDSSGVMTCEEDEEHVHKDCHCDGDAVHCSDPDDESMCVCFEGGDLLECAECECHGDHPHCEVPEDEEFCTCTSAGDLSCDFALKEQNQTKPWGEVVLASFVVNLVTLIGVVVIAGDYARKLFCPNVSRRDEDVLLWTDNIIPMFAAGALLATTFFLILPEALYMIGSAFGDPHAGHDHRFMQEEAEKEGGEAAATWRFGTAILGGFLIPVCIHAIVPHNDAKKDKVATEPLDAEDEAEEDNSIGGPKPADLVLEKGDDKTPKSEESENVGAPSMAAVEDASVGESETTDVPMVAEQATEDVAVITSAVEAEDKDMSTSGHPEQDDTLEEARGTRCCGRYTGCFRDDHDIDLPLLASIFIADFFHNFADGVFIGVSFLQCNRDLAITITLATIAHELSQELADYFLLTNQCGLTRCTALAINFACGMSIMFGSLVMVGSNISNFGVGIILCISGGVYIHLAVAECYPTAQKAQKKQAHKAYGILFFMVGCVVIGLVLLNHQHC